MLTPSLCKIPANRDEPLLGCVSIMIVFILLHPQISGFNFPYLISFFFFLAILNNFP